jgi:hypothetical protein
VEALSKSAHIPGLNREEIAPVPNRKSPERKIHQSHAPRQPIGISFLPATNCRFSISNFTTICMATHLHFLPNATVVFTLGLHLNGNSQKTVTVWRR